MSNTEETPKFKRDEKGKFVKGTAASGKGGRPKGAVSLFNEVKRQLEEQPENIRELARKFLQRCLEDDRPFEHLAARLDGPIPTKVESDKPLTQLSAMIVLGEQAREADDQLRKRGMITSTPKANGNGNGSH